MGIITRHIWIASHFHSLHRIELFKSTLQSIENQIVKPDRVILSFSLQENLCNLKSEIFNLKQYCTIPFEILYQDSRLYQFEHLHKIYDFVSNELDGNHNNSLYISFCDDDDFLHEHYITTTNDFISIGYDKIHCKFYRMEKGNELYHDRFNKFVVGKYCEFGGMTCSFKYFEDFIHSPYYEPSNPTCDLLCSCFKSRHKEIKINTPLYYYRSSLYCSYHQIWRFPKELTNSLGYYKILQDTANLPTNIRDHVISDWLYKTKSGKILDSDDNHRKFIDESIAYHTKVMKQFISR